jgi:hypothetical protein
VAKQEGSVLKNKRGVEEKSKKINIIKAMQAMNADIGKNLV